MVKNESLSDDLNFVREFEELKLKQKLLVDSLSRKNATHMNEFLVEINSKLDFLVKIFKDTQENDSIEEEHNYLDEKFNLILDKIDEKFKEVDSKFLDMEEKFIGLKTLVNKIDDSLDNGSNKSNVSELPPTPNFKANISKEISDVSDSSKKKKWF